jgi:4-amino-4-deoxy-L-arabinose transferase-like glycosyltransferase
VKKENYIEFIIIGLLIILASVLVFNNLGKSVRHDWDESVFAENALEMFQSHNFITSAYAHIPDIASGRFPLAIWLITLSFSIFGINEFAVRFWSAFFAVLTIVVVYLFGKKIAGRTAGIMASLLLLINPCFMGYDLPGLWPHGARTGDSDVILTFFIVASLYFFYLFEEKNKKRYIVASALIIGLAVMTKSIAGLPPALIIFLYILYNGKLKKILSKEYLWGLLSFLAVTVPWIILRYINNGKPFFGKMIFYHIVERISKPIEGHYGDSLYYIYQIKNNLGVVLSLILIASFIYAIYLIIKKKSKPAFILSAWIVFYLLAFTIAQTKLFWYIIPAYPAIALLIGQAIADFSEYVKFDKKIFFTIFFIIMAQPLLNSYDASNIIHADNDYNSLIRLKPEMENYRTIYFLYKDGQVYDNGLNRPSIFFYLNTFSKIKLKPINNLSKIPEGGVIILRDNQDIINIYKTQKFQNIDQNGNLLLFKKI